MHHRSELYQINDNINDDDDDGDDDDDDDEWLYFNISITKFNIT